MATIELRLSQAMDKLREKRGAIPQCVGVVPTENAREYRMTFAKAVSQHHMTNMREALPDCTFLLPVECSDPSKACIVLAHVPNEWLEGSTEPVEQAEEQPAPIVEQNQPERRMTVMIDLATGKPADLDEMPVAPLSPAAKTVEQRIKEAFAGAHGGKAKDITTIARVTGVALPNEYRLTSRVSINKDAQFGAHGLDRVLFASVYTMTFTVPDAWIDAPSGTRVPEELDSAEESALKSFYALATTNPSGYWTSLFACASERASEHLATVRGMLDKSADMAHGTMYRINAKGASSIGKPYPPEVANVKVDTYTAADEIKSLEVRLAAAQERIQQLEADRDAAQRRVDDLTAKDARTTDSGWTFVRVEDWNRDQARINDMLRIIEHQRRALLEAVNEMGAKERRVVTTPITLSKAVDGAPLTEVDNYAAFGWKPVQYLITPPSKAVDPAYLVTVMERTRPEPTPSGKTAAEQEADYVAQLNDEIEPEAAAARDALAGVIRWHNNAPSLVPVLASGQVQS